MAGSHHSGPLPRLALCGEFSAGKSSIVNLLLGCDMLPTSVLSSTRRPTHLRYAPSLQIEAISETGQREPVSPGTISLLSREDISHFDVGMPAEFLRHVELLDTPGFADPFHDHHSTLDAVEGTDICIWCTLATQAWRESERQTWLSLPSHFRGDGILVVTHVDTLANSGEQGRVRSRLEREAGDLFGDIVLLAVPDAVRAVQAGNRIADPGLWQDSGGSALVAALEKVVTGYHAARGKRIRGAAAMPWIGLGFEPGSVAESRPAEPAMAAAPRNGGAPDAPSSAPEPPAEAAPVPASESDRFLARVMETVPACLATTWIDLARQQLLLFREKEPNKAGAADTQVSAVLGEAITDLFQGANVSKIEAAFRMARGLSEHELHYFKEIFIMTEDCVGVFLRSASRPDRVLAVVTDKTVNLGMVLSRARSLMAATDRLP
jgi:hypothetical protein